MTERTSEFNVQLDEAHAVKLRALAARTQVDPGTLPRSLLSTALEQADPDVETITALLDSIPGALERAQQGLAEARSGRGIPLEDL